MSVLVASRREGAVAKIVARRTLRYESAERETGRLPYVRAASGLAWQIRDGAEVLIIAQDDSSFLAYLRPPDGPVRSIVLSYAPGGHRVFEERRGTKKLKMDLESCAAIDLTRALVFGSGSLAPRERVVDLTGERARIVEAPELYAALRATPDFAGCELNVEGACRIGDRLLLANRGNGAGHPSAAAVDGLAEVDLKVLLAYLDKRGPCPAIERARACDLGSIEGGRLTFTDLTSDAAATKTGKGRVYFLAAAERSPNTYDDGEVVGAAIGTLDPTTNELVVVPLLDEKGQPSRDKPEGLAIAPSKGKTKRFYAVVDVDDPDLASALLTIELTGI